MARRFELFVSIRSGSGFDHCGQFDLGCDSQFAHQLYEKLECEEKSDRLGCLYIDLMETTDELPEKIKTKYCNLDQLAKNTKIIVRELFKLRNLEVL